MKQIGRSMVETLGVLAIIGVLSIGAIAGYKFAVDMYRANDIANEVQLRYYDIKSTYQFKNLSDTLGTDWPNTTNTGFAIDVIPFPPKVFEVRVSGVQSDVCRHVLNLGFENEWAIFIAADSDETIDLESRAEYTGDKSLCDLDDKVQLVFISTTDEIPENASFCLSDTQCQRQKDACYECVDNICEVKPGMEGGREGECDSGSKKCCAPGFGLNPASCLCEEIPEVCNPGEYRLANGLCEDCAKGYNRIVLNEKYVFPGVEIQDTQTGVEMCEACGNREPVVQDANGNWWCPFTCVSGVTFQTKTPDETTGSICHPCTDETSVEIVNETVAKNQCSACQDGKHVWWGSGINPLYCGIRAECTAGTQFKDSAFTCANCSDHPNEVVYLSANRSSDPNLLQEMIDLCNDCPNRWAGPVYSYASKPECRCYPTCTQPADGGEICKTNPLSDSCTRKWQDWTGKCYECDYTGKAGNIIGRHSSDIIPELKELCEKCGRTVNSAGYCVLSGNNIPLGKFQGADGALYDCTDGIGVLVESAEESGCLTNCRKTGDDYVLNGEEQTRQMYGDRCIPVNCATDHYYNTHQKVCVKCPSLTNLGSLKIADTTIDFCGNACPEAKSYGTSCAPKNCPTDKKYFRETDGACNSCTSTTVARYIIQHEQEGIDVCNQCGNRIAVPIGNKTYCVLLKPGEYGICNSKTLFPSGVAESLFDADLVNDAQDYLNEIHDGEKIINYDGKCVSCDTKTTIETTQEQCNMCANRRYGGGVCSYGLCSDGTEFINAGKNCVKCSEGGIQTEIPHDASARSSCDSCTGKRALIAADKSYCVQECTETGYFQASNGDCVTCGTNGIFDIGSDDISVELCRKCDKEPVCTTDTETGVKTCVCQ